MKMFLQIPAVAIALLTVGMAQGAVIWTDDFEDGNAAGWIEVWGNLPDLHAFQPQTYEFTLPLPSPAGGNRGLWVQEDNVWAARSGGTIADGTTYTVTAAVGRLKLSCNPNSPLWHLQLYAGTSSAPATLLSEIAYNSPGANLPNPDNWASDSVLFNSTGSGHVGETLWVRLYSDVNGLENSYFDNVTLTASPIPEPGSLLMLAGAAAMWLLGRKLLRRR